MSVIKGLVSPYALIERSKRAAAYQRDYRTIHGRPARTPDQKKREAAQARARRHAARYGPLPLPVVAPHDNMDRAPVHAPRAGDMTLFGEPLTRSERRLVAEVAVHGTLIEAAICVGISGQTAKNHVAAVLQKLGIRRLIRAYELLGWMAIPRRELPRHPGVDPHVYRILTPGVRRGGTTWD